MLSSIRKFLSPLNTLLKYTVSILALVYIGYRIATTSFSPQHLYEFFNPTLLIVVGFLTIGNWIFEILKWKVVINTFKNISFKTATYQTLVAYTYGMITPFNSGNYAKKIFFYPKEQGKRIVFLNLSKGIYQMLTTIFFGVWGVFVLMNEINFELYNQQLFFILTSCVGVIALIIYRVKILQLVKSLSIKVHLQLFLYSVIKFVCFSFVLMVLLHQENLPLLKLYAGICAVYLLSSLLPILNILDFAIKGSVALWVLSPLGYSQQNILIAYFVLWICNHASPSILGSILQFYKSKEH
ncbi:hypothetical protein [Wenyingzhuangia aestuarii]|uniref:hypothetical protein n=1 Tax=Wenyingzhuangia aestuarii TaxID=1647582 RepID=UPI00143B167D|nr:hypothetical protein [Wenyingzhuangia aestuarii]NJB82830.1 hypothetical protein [Wenyingzhuangia aestuarii]